MGGGGVRLYNDSSEMFSYYYSTTLLLSDPRQTGHYVLEAKRDEKWEPLPLQLAIMLGGKVTANDTPVHNPAFDGDNVKLDIKVSSD